MTDISHRAHINYLKIAQMAYWAGEYPDKSVIQALERSGLSKTEADEFYTKNYQSIIKPLPSVSISCAALKHIKALLESVDTGRDVVIDGSLVDWFDARDKLLRILKNK